MTKTAYLIAKLENKKCTDLGIFSEASPTIIGKVGINYEQIILFEAQGKNLGEAELKLVGKIMESCPLLGEIMAKVIEYAISKEERAIKSLEDLGGLIKDETGKVDRPGGGYQPEGPPLDTSNPPRGGSGVPSKPFDTSKKIVRDKDWWERAWYDIW